MLWLIGGGLSLTDRRRTKGKSRSSSNPSGPMLRLIGVVCAEIKSTLTLTNFSSNLKIIPFVT